jgi:hypothetical protein
MAQPTDRQTGSAQAGPTTRPEQQGMASGPSLELSTHYRIQVKGAITVPWLKGFGGLGWLLSDEAEVEGECTVLHAHTDQSGMVGLVRELHGLGVTILQVQVIP